MYNFKLNVETGHSTGFGKVNDMSHISHYGRQILHTCIAKLVHIRRG